MATNPKPTENPKSNVGTQKRHQKTSIPQRLMTDFGRSVGVTTATLLLWIHGLQLKPSQYPQKLCNQKDTPYKICE